ncbi:MAG: hypothetical protein ABSA76_06290, partial [Bacteroidales bacterium]
MATNHGATLNGTVNPNGLDTTVKFLYGIDPTLVNPIEVDVADVIPAGHDVVSVEAPVTDLLEDTTYYFKISAENSAGIAEGLV